MNLDNIVIPSWNNRLPWGGRHEPLEKVLRENPLQISSSAMVVNGRRPGAEDADHGKNGKTERLLEEHRASEHGNRSRWLPFAAKARQQAETVDQCKEDHHREQQDL
jgi:hypothetical protein